MAEASRVHSTPHLSTSLNNTAESTATDRVDASRRRFLSQAAAVTAGGVAVATALSVPGSAAGAVQAADPTLEAIAPALRRPVLTMDGSGASDELRSAFRTLDDAHEVLKTAWAEYRRVVDLTRDWEREHPSSAGGGSNRVFRKWDRRRSKYFDEINYNAVCRAYHVAAEDFKDAQLAAAGVKVRDLDELALKACAVYAYEDMREGHLRRITPVISVSVAVDLARMSLPKAG
jgi:hypothetical protein